LSNFASEEFKGYKMGYKMRGNNEGDIISTTKLCAE